MIKLGQIVCGCSCFQWKYDQFSIEWRRWIDFWCFEKKNLNFNCKKRSITQKWQFWQDNSNIWWLHETQPATKKQARIQILNIYVFGANSKLKITRLFFSLLPAKQRSIAKLNTTSMNKLNIVGVLCCFLFSPHRYRYLRCRAVNFVDIHVRLSNGNHKGKRHRQQAWTKQITQSCQKWYRRIVRVDFVLPHHVNHYVRDIKQCADLKIATKNKIRMKKTC